MAKKKNAKSEARAAAKKLALGKEQVKTAALKAATAPDETVILLHPPLPLVGVSIVMERERQQNDSLVNVQAATACTDPLAAL